MLLSYLLETQGIVDNATSGNGTPDNILNNGNALAMILTTIGILAIIIVFTLGGIRIITKIINNKNDKGDE